jgi:hypothetical protein
MKLSSDFDWVAARSRCSLAVVFQQIASEVEEDVRKRNAKCPKDCGYEFSVIGPSASAFTVLLTGDRVDRKLVKFNQTSKGITVHKDGSLKPSIEASLTLNNDGECRLKIGTGEYDFWQFRRMALEELFFEAV